MFNRKPPKTFAGTLLAGQPFEDFESAVESPDSVTENLERMRPMIQDIRAMAMMPGWTKYIGPFLAKKQSPHRLLELIEEGKDARVEAAQIKAFGAILNLVNSMVRSGDSMDRLAAEKAEREKADAEAAAKEQL
jgi:hypothetical protein